MTEIKLSVCIATCNRAAFIGATLDSIVSQATDEVEIVIVDGASTDSTEAIVRDYQPRCPHLRYFRQAANMGVDRDYTTAVELARGTYCWLMTDDDLLKPGAVRAVLKEIEHEYSLIIVNGEVRTPDLSKVVASKRLPVPADRVYRPSEREQLFVETANYLSFIGGVVVKRELWNQRDKARYFGTVFVHVGVIFQSSLPGDTLAIAEPWVIIRYGNALWTAKGFEVWMFKWPGLIWSFPDISSSAKGQVWPREPWRKIRTLVFYRAIGAFSSEEYERWLRRRLEPGWRKMLTRLIASTPGPVANLLAILYMSVFHRGSPVSLVDLKKSRFHVRQYLRGLVPAGASEK